MKKVQMMVAVLLLLMGAMFASVSAQTVGGGNDSNTNSNIGGSGGSFNATVQPVKCFLSDPYTVVVGDSLWKLRQKEWKALVECNPYLSSGGRSFTKTDGTYVVVIKPKETLYGVTKVDGRLMPVTDSLLTDTKTVATPFSQLPVEQESSTWWNLVYWLMAAVIIAAIVWFLLPRKSKSAAPALNPAAPAHNAVATDPTTAGPPMVPGGLTEENATEVFQRAAARQAGRPLDHQQFTVIERVRGRIYGPMTVSYAEGRPQDWNMTGQQAYQARVRFPNGHEETLYMLQACGNDLRYQGVNRYQPGEGFRFVPDPIDVSVPASVAPTVAPAVPAEPNEAVVEGEVKLEVKPQSDDQGAMVRLTGVKPEDVTFIMNATGFTLRYKAPTTPAA